MPFYEREGRILNALLEKESMTTQELSAKLYVSVPTLRRDLLKLEQMGKIIRTHGGAQIIKKSADDIIPFFLREQEQNGAKSVIAQKAAEFVKDGDTIMLDGSTSIYSLVPLLADFRNLIVITSSAKSSYLLGEMGIRNICTGGHMIIRSLSYVGDDAIRTVRNYNADVVFFSCRGISMDGRLTDSSIEENSLRKAMIKQSEKAVCLCDSSKIGHTFLNNLCHISEIDNLICDEPIPQKLLDLMK
ncbi:MAG: DeoR/GlpR family DNA-binding transcription regulator [Eubacteriales bacterium]